LPWSIGGGERHAARVRNWTTEVYDSLGALVIKCMNDAEAIELISVAETLAIVPRRKDLP
jgi:hypothetical protein